MNSNSFWLETFRKLFRQVIPISVSQFVKKYNTPSRFNKLLSDHSAVTNVHFGGSAKLGSYVPIKTLTYVKSKRPNVRITSFYGDVYKNPYIEERAYVIDLSIITNASFLNKENKKLIYKPCPIDSGWIRPNDEPKKYDIIFVGNNYSSIRMSYLKKVSALTNKMGLSFVVVGKGWKQSTFESNTLLLGSKKLNDAVDLYRQSKIAIDDPIQSYCQYTAIKKCHLNHPRPTYRPSICSNIKCKDYSPNYKYFSNRPMMILASGTPFIACKRPGQEEVIPHAYYFQGPDSIPEIEEHIAYILDDKNNESVKETILKGQHLARENTFQRMANCFVVDQQNMLYN
jgi:hypothetical protein